MVDILQAYLDIFIVATVLFDCALSCLASFMWEKQNQRWWIGGFNIGTWLTTLSHVICQNCKASNPQTKSCTKWFVSWKMSALSHEQKQNCSVLCQLQSIDLHQIMIVHHYLLENTRIINKIEEGWTGKFGSSIFHVLLHFCRSFLRLRSQKINLWPQYQFPSETQANIYTKVWVLLSVAEQESTGLLCKSLVLSHYWYRYYQYNM